MIIKHTKQKMRVKAYNQSMATKWLNNTGYHVHKLKIVEAINNQLKLYEAIVTQR